MENLFALDRGLSIIASGPLPEEKSGGGAVDLTLIVKRGDFYRYECPGGLPEALFIG